MKTLVIGAGGFAGQYLIEELQKGCDEIYATKLPQDDIRIESIPYYDLDIRNYEEVSEIIKKVRPDRIYHLAAVSSSILSWKIPQKTVEINIIGAINIFEAVVASGIKSRMLLVGSAEEYGASANTNDAVHESFALKPLNVYAVTKIAQSMLGDVYRNAYGIEVVAVRSFNHFGPHQSADFAASDFCRQIAEIEAGQREAIYVGNLSSIRDYTDVRDVVRAYTMIMEKGITGKTYNVGGGNVISIQELLYKIIELSDAHIKVETDPNKFRPVEIPKIKADITELQRDTGWKPHYSIDMTLRDTLNYWRQKIKSNSLYQNML